MIRIISGQFGGLRLHSPRHHLRPTTDRVKEYIFNVCRDFAQAHVADLFSGTGSLGFEAMSRGAVLVHSVDVGRKSCQLIRKNHDKLGNPGEFQLFQRKSEKFIHESTEKYDYIMADPPYDYSLDDIFFHDVKKALHEGGKFIFEYRSKWTGGDSFPLECIKEKKFGETGVWIYE